MALTMAATQTGEVSGVPCGNPAYTVFRGIPYGAAPVGENRWLPPTKPAPWRGVRACHAFPPAGVQSTPKPGDFYQKEFFETFPAVSEDCLYLNVWTPAERPGAGLPVMVWIHGGAFLAGFGHEIAFDGEALCKRGVLLVTINYRLNALGFFAHPALSARDPRGVSGNYALLDQAFALMWVHENIAAFGGDANNVTLFGQSAGGASVLAQCASPCARGLVHRAIIQSAGPARDEPHTRAQAEQFGAFVCAHHGITVNDLLGMPPETVNGLVMAATGAYAQPFKLRMRPCVDGVTLPDDPYALFARGGQPDIPYMTGFVSGDRATADAEADGGIRARRHFRYHFDRDVPGSEGTPAFHSSELWYVFATLARCWRPMTGHDFELSLRMTDYWANFAKHGDPNGEGLPNWSPHTAQAPFVMRFA